MLGLAPRFSNARYTLGNVRGPFGFISNNRGNDSSGSSTVRLRGRHLLDQETLTCLLVLLFVDEPKLNTNRLHRVLRNLCYHGHTRTWVIKSLLSILQKSSENCDNDKNVSKRQSTSAGSSGGAVHGGSNTMDNTTTATSSEVTASGPDNTCISTPKSSDVQTFLENSATRSTSTNITPSWLSMSMDAALGCRTHVFQIHRVAGRKHSTSGSSNLFIHPQASPIICRHVLDTLISLAKSFPVQFLPSSTTAQNKNDKAESTPKVVKAVECGGTQKQLNSPLKTSTPTQQTKAESSKDCTNKSDIDFWECLMKLDAISGSRKMKSLQRTHSAVPDSTQSNTTYESSALGQLMTMLQHPVIRRSQLLTDRLLRLLGLVSIGLPGLANQRNQATPSISSSNRGQYCCSIISIIVG